MYYVCVLHQPNPHDFILALCDGGKLMLKIKLMMSQVGM